MNDHWPTLQTKINITIMGLLSILFLVPAFAAEDIEIIESVTIVGSAEDARNLPGSVTVISNEDLKKKLKDKIISEDDSKNYEKNIQKLTDLNIENIEKILSDKEKEIIQI